MKPSLVVPVFTMFVATACTSGQVGVAPSVPSADVAKTSVLQFAVGSANVAFADGRSFVALNAVETFRQPNGLTATLVNYPLLTGPYFPGANHQLFTERPDDIATATAQIAAGIAPTLTDLFKKDGDLGPFFQATGDGFGESNRLVTIPTATDSCTTTEFAGDIVSNGPRDANIKQPIYAYQLPGSASNTTLCERQPAVFSLIQNPTRFYGASPLWPSPTGYNQPAYFRGYPLGFTIFANVAASTDSEAPIPLIAGNYGLDVSYPTNATSSAYGHFTASATLTARAVSAPLPTATAPSIQPQSDGSAFINVTIPTDPRIVESIVEIESDYCDLASAIAQGVTGQPAPNHYSFVTYATGAQTLLVPNNLGAPAQSFSTVPTHSFCTYADDRANAIATSIPLGPTGPPHIYTATVVSFDYPAFETSYPKNLSPRPKITSGDGFTGTADLSISAPTNGHYNTSAGS